MIKASQKKRIRKSQNRSFNKNLFFVILTVVLAFAAVSILGKNGILDLIKLQGMQHSLEKENAELSQQQEELKAEIERLQTSPYIESLARERFGLMRPNEVFLIVDSPSAQ